MPVFIEFATERHSSTESIYDGLRHGVKRLGPVRNGFSMDVCLARAVRGMDAALILVSALPGASIEVRVSKWLRVGNVA